MKKRGKKDLTISQCADAMQKLLEREIEGIMTRKQLRVMAKYLVEDMQMTQTRNRNSRISATKERWRELHAIGITSSQLCSVWPSNPSL